MNDLDKKSCPEGALLRRNVLDSQSSQPGSEFITLSPPEVKPREAAIKRQDIKPRWSLARIIYTGAGLGLAPKAPGTFGTILAVPIFYLISGFNNIYYFLFLIAVFMIGCWASGKAEADLGRHDAPEVVIDEVAGYLLSMFMAPASAIPMLLGFVFFRFFDILKPWPVSWADKKIPGALGVMLDDIFAGVYAWLALRFCLVFLI